MGYSTSRATLKTMTGYLDQFIDGKVGGWQMTDAIAAKRWAYKIREALHIAKLYPKEFPLYAQLSDMYRVTTDGKYVRLEPATETKATGIAHGSTVIEARSILEAPTVDGEPEVKTPDAPLDWTVENIKAICISKANEERILFRGANLSPEEMINLYGWAQSQDPKWLILESFGDLTMRKFSQDFADVAWTPEDLL